MGKQERYLQRQKKIKEKIIAKEQKLQEQFKIDVKYMYQALNRAKKAQKIGEVPIGCIIVYNNRVISGGYNRRNIDKNTLAHAEITAIKRACKKLNDWRLENCTLYVTLEPCPMCAGAIIQARIPRVVIGCMNKKAGSVGSVTNLFKKAYNHEPVVVYDILHDECSKILKDFFKALRLKC